MRNMRLICIGPIPIKQVIQAYHYSYLSRFPFILRFDTYKSASINNYDG